MNLERIWLAMTDALCRHEVVHIIARDEQQRDHIAYLLDHYGMDTQNIDLWIIPTDDVWARDNGPIFIVNDQGDLAITDWNFNGWGGRLFIRETRQESIPQYGRRHRRGRPLPG